MDKLIYDKSTRTIRSSLLDKERAAHLDTLKRVEWCVFDGFGNGYCCPECKGFEEHGHRDKCQIDADIKRLEGK